MRNYLKPLLRQFVLYYPEEESYSGLRSAKLGLSFKVKFDYHAKIVCSAFFYYPLCLSDNMTPDNIYDNSLMWQFLNPQVDFHVLENHRLIWQSLYMTLLIIPSSVILSDRLCSCFRSDFPSLFVANCRGVRGSNIYSSAGNSLHKWHRPFGLKGNFSLSSQLALSRSHVHSLLNFSLGLHMWCRQ